MTLMKIKIPPGVVRDRTRYSTTGSWWDCDKIRFRNGVPQPIGGWALYNDTPFVGSCRALLAWASLSNMNYLSVGTNIKLYVVSGGVLTDVTPIRRAPTLGTDPIATTNTSTTLTLTDANHGSNIGDYVTLSGATATNGVPADEINAEHIIQTVPTTSTYTIEVTTAATSTGSGGGSSVVGSYQLNVGPDSGVLSGGGWGAGTWSHADGWSSSSASVSITGTLRTWSLANWGEDLLAAPRNGQLYLWDTSAGGAATLVSDIAGATGVPTTIKQVLVTSQRAAMCFGVNPIGSAIQDTVLVRWSDLEDYTDFTPTSVNSAGSLRLNSGSTFVSAIETRQEILAWTDASLHSIQYVGGDFVYGVTTIAQSVDIVGPNARAAGNDIVVWMGRDAFYIYDGRVRNLPCAVWEKVFRDFNAEQAQKVCAATNMTYEEFWFFYPSASSSENDKYVFVNISTNEWAFGNLSRTAFIDHGIYQYPLGASDDKYIYYHEFGIDDGSTNPVSALNAYIESGPVELGDGDRVMFCTKMLPDVSFVGSTATSPSVTLTFNPQNYPGGALLTAPTGTVTRTTADSVAIQEFDEIKYIRYRGRSIALKVQSTDVGVTWKFGDQRLDVRPDGRRT